MLFAIFFSNMVFPAFGVQQSTPSAPYLGAMIFDQTVDRSSNSFSNFIGWFGKIGVRLSKEGSYNRFRMITID